MAKVKTNRSFEFGQSRATGLGTLKFDENGESQELEDQVAKTLSEVSPSLSVVGAIEDATIIDDENQNKVELTKAPNEELDLSQDTENIDVNDATTVDSTQEQETVENTEEVVDKADDSVKLTKEQLEQIPMGELRDTLIEAGCPAEEVNKFKGRDQKDELVDYAFEKL